MPWAGYENRCRAEKLPFTVGGVDSGYSPGLYAAGSGPNTDSKSGGSDAGNADCAAIFNAAAGSIPNPNARTGNAHSGGNQQRGRGYGPLYLAD